MKRLSGFVVIVCVFLSTFAVADVFYSFKEGLEYERIDISLAKKRTNRMTVMEMFRYDCPACYKLEIASVAGWLKSRPKDVDYERMPFTGTDAGSLYALVFYTIEALDLLDSLHLEFFMASMDKTKNVRTEEGVVKFFVDNGVTREAFYKAFNSPEVRKKYQKADELSQLFISGTLPAFLVNNKFLIQDNRLFTTNDVYLVVVDQLLARERELITQE